MFYRDRSLRDKNKEGTPFICVRLRCRTIFQIVREQRFSAAQFEKLCDSNSPVGDNKIKMLSP
jgi:hypothetical protein